MQVLKKMNKNEGQGERMDEWGTHTLSTKVIVSPREVCVTKNVRTAPVQIYSLKL